MQWEAHDLVSLRFLKLSLLAIIKDPRLLACPTVWVLFLVPTDCFVAPFILFWYSVSSQSFGSWMVL